MGADARLATVQPVRRGHGSDETGLVTGYALPIFLWRSGQFRIVRQGDLAGAHEAQHSDQRKGNDTHCNQGRNHWLGHTRRLPKR